jgi:hypothetical protein
VRSTRRAVTSCLRSCDGTFAFAIHRTDKVCASLNRPHNPGRGGREKERTMGNLGTTDRRTFLRRGAMGDGAFWAYRCGNWRHAWGIVAVR